MEMGLCNKEDSHIAHPFATTHRYYALQVDKTVDRVESVLVLTYVYVCEDG